MSKFPVGMIVGTDKNRKYSFRNGQDKECLYGRVYKVKIQNTEFQKCKMNYYLTISDI